MLLVSILMEPPLPPPAPLDFPFSPFTLICPSFCSIVVILRVITPPPLPPVLALPIPPPLQPLSTASNTCP